MILNFQAIFNAIYCYLFLIVVLLEGEVGVQQRPPLLVQRPDVLGQVGDHAPQPLELGNALAVLRHQPPGAGRQLLRGAVTRDVLHLLALTPAVQEVKHAEADQLERVAVAPFRVVVATSCRVLLIRVIFLTRFWRRPGI